MFVVAVLNFFASGLNVYNVVAGNHSAISAAIATFSFGIGILFSLLYARR